MPRAGTLRTPSQALNPEACARCGYDLEGLDPHARCPECACPRVPIDAYFHCPHCGYHLTGLSPESNCPECGNPASDAIVDFPISRAGPGYIGSLASGAHLLLVSLGLFVGAVGLPFTTGIFLPILVRISGGGLLSAGGGIILFLGAFVLGLCSAITWLVGMTRLATQDPVYRDRAPSNNTRIISLVLSIAVFCMPFAVFIPIAGTVVSYLFPICVIAWYLSLTSYIAHIARRIPSFALLKAATRARLIGTILLSTLTLGTIAYAFSGSNRYVVSQMLAGTIGYLGWILTLALLVIYGLLIWQLRRVLKRCRRSVIEMTRHTHTQRSTTPVDQTRTTP